jgi:hypothetical protein
LTQEERVAAESEEVVGLLKEIRNWMRVGFYGNVRDLLREALREDKQRRAYQLADGDLATDNIRKLTGQGYTTVQALFTRCCELGLMESPDGKRYRRLFDLTNFGMAPEDLLGAEGKEA